MKDFSTLISNSFKNIDAEELKSIISENLRPSIKVIILLILATGIAYPLLLVAIGQISLPFQSNGSLLTFDGKVIGSKLIAQEFKSDKFFHIRPAANSTSGVDPHITPEDAYSQVARVSNATGLQQNLLKTAIQLNIERNKVSNAVAFAPQYVNVLEVNLDLLTGYPEIYQEFIKDENMNSTGVR
jgi:K+-transporting ATPase ATPase C chain